MFKPSLKRSRIPDQSLGVDTQRRQSYPTNYASTDPKKQTIALRPNLIIPGQLLQSPELVDNKPFTHILNPLTSAYFAYPEAVQQYLSVDNSTMTYRGIGCFDKLFWLYFDNKVILWKDDSHNCKTNDMANKIRTIAVGRLTEVAVHFKKNSLVVMCVAIENEVWLYSVNLDTLKIDDLKLKYHLGNALAVEQILFIGMNRILMVGDTGAIQLAVFDDKQSIRSISTSMLSFLLPANPLLGSSSQRHVLQVVSTQQLIYVLVKKVSESNWLVQKLKGMVNSFLNEAEQSSYTTQERFIEVYSINKKKIKYQYTVKQRNLEQIIISHSLYDGNNIKNGFRIESIYLDRRGGNQGMLGIVLRCGYICMLRNDPHVIIQGDLVLIPKTIGEVGLFVQKRFLSAPRDFRRNEVIFSLGYRNLTLMTDCLLYLDEERVDVILTNGLIGQVFERTHTITGAHQLFAGPGASTNVVTSGSQREWVIFSKTGYHIINQLKQHHLVLVYLFYRCEVIMQEGGPAEYQFSFECIMDNISKSLGATQFCFVLLDILLQGQALSFRVNSDFYEEFVRQEVRGHPNTNFDEWAHELSKEKPSRILFPTQKMLEAAWNLLLQHQYKQPRQRPLYGSVPSRQCSAYWYALQRSFYNIIQPIMKLQAQNYKQSIVQVQFVQQSLKQMQLFIEEKRKQQRIINWKTRKPKAPKNRRMNLAERNWSNLTGNYDQSIPENLKQPTNRGDDSTNWASRQQQQGKTMDTTIYQDESVSYHGSQAMMENCNRLESIILSAIPKVNALIQIFFRLMEVPEKEGFPTFENVIKYVQDQCQMKAQLVNLLRDSLELLEEISDTIPQLGLQKDLVFLRWQTIRKRISQKDSDIDVQAIANSLSGRLLPELMNMGIGLPKTLEILIEYSKVLDEQYSSMIQSNTTQEKTFLNNDVFASDELTIIEQRRNSINKEKEINENEIKKLIAKVVQQLTTCPLNKYADKERDLDEVIRGVALQKSLDLRQFLQYQLKDARMVQKVVQYNQILRNNEQKPAFWSRLFQGPVTKSLDYSFSKK